MDNPYLVMVKQWPRRQYRLVRAPTIADAGRVGMVIAMFNLATLQKYEAEFGPLVSMVA